MTEEYGISRFLRAQERDYRQALAEIRAGRKRSHWIWYIFPQLQGLGHSPTAEYYGIRGMAEAKAYLADPVLKARLLEISGALLELDGSDPTAVMGYPDDLKLRSSMTLFREAAPGEPVFRQVLDKYFEGKPDRTTMMLLAND